MKESQRIREKIEIENKENFAGGFQNIVKELSFG